MAAEQSVAESPVMCGLAGYWSSRNGSAEHAAVLRCMTQALRHRGPDDEGQWIDAPAGIALGHRRLAVLDLSSAGHQPMVSRGGRYVIAFNGEIYNHADLRGLLPTAAWRGHSDTETLLAAIEEWGLQRALQETVGMFAFALWDCTTRTLSLARDRLGEKPLYFGRLGPTLLFASELKALQGHPEFRAEVDMEALRDYVCHGYVRAPRSIYKEIHKVPPGTIVHVRGDASAPISNEAFWDLESIVAARAARMFVGSASDAVDEIEVRVRAAVKLQQLADVPVGAFLSGGVDSSSVVALMQAQSMIPVKTFSVGFAESQYNEAPSARAVAKHLGTEHTELLVTARDALEIIPRLPTVYDEPFADPSQIPTILVAALARKHVTVALSGDGGDELFCGYERYPTTLKVWRRLARIPPFVRGILGRAASSHRFGRGLGAANVDDFYEFVNSQWKDHPGLVTGQDGRRAAKIPRAPAEVADARERMMYADTRDYLPDDVLVKVDRAAMAASLEARVPFLDHRVVEFAWTLPVGIKAFGGAGKWPLKQLLYRYVPRSLVDRPKQGFGIPLEHWLRGPLREWSEDLLSQRRLAAHGLLDEQAVRKEWQIHLSGKRDRHYSLWTVLMFQAWYAAHL
jgi:asparagine synthase (glutamine-hydrolysing)